ncbi:FhaA domain-containing protein, partial [Streptomyces sp. NPDC003860]
MLALSACRTWSSAKVFKSEVQPVEIAGALQRECDNNATIW